ncbi:SusC/RagA family TonB-linked outer membrane protein [Lacihabitans sp. LS3-19]|uniref:SusC/RagA family TonB-linked outer membrane protein n=1 Tax=Lacihabitans sp. LS3-19 TaxID=2487335 RepID=UPI0020CBB802|nr:SusC/RagA family TonB-linked outer membrane protein [Lacihabitans sp. LS3-19]MCP9768698.1 SusC/RagA family TonB-linked outer membrane protein [Lacihabitans sp. LS3-19]
MVKKLPSLIVLFLMISIQIFAQNIRGVVVSAIDGEPLPGVSVVVKGTTTGTATDTKGAFSIKATPKSTLIFSFIGFADQEVEVGNSSVLNVAMQEDVSVLDEVVVTALGITKEQRAIGYATSTIKSEEITRTASPNFASALYGKAPGVVINATPGGATSGVNINIRGFASITGNTQPLIVLDGIPIRSGEFRNTSYWSNQRIQGNGLLDINPADIENISILKGASAAALYGSEAVNGVLLITTKSGKGKKGIGVDFSSSFTYDKIAYLPRYQNVRGPGYPKTLANANQDENLFIKYADGSRGLINTSVNFGPKFDGQPVRAWTGEMVPYSASNSSYADLFQNANSSNINLSVSKSSDNSNMRFSFTRQDNQMISPGSKNAKNIANLNTSFNLGKRSKTDVMVNYVNQATHNRPYKVDRMINNFTGMMDRFEKAEWYNKYYQTSLGYKFRTGTQASATPDENITYNGFRGDIADFVWRVYKHNDDEASNRVIASITENFKITEDLSIRTRIATDFTSEENKSERATEVPLVIGNSGAFISSQNRYSNVYGDVLLTYTKKINESLGINVLGGYIARKQQNRYMTTSTNGGLATENYFDLSSSLNQANASFARENLVNDAWIGTVNADIKDYLYLEATLRKDRYSTMNPNNNSFFYPSVNTGFVLSDAFKMPTGISYSKLRASYGIVGNYPGVYAANVAYTQATLGVQSNGGKPVLYTTIPSNFGNESIRPEQKHEVEIGWETKFLHNRFGFDFSYYNAKIVDQILPLDIAASTGARSILTNIGTLRNQGLELRLTAVPIKSNNLNWDVTLNLAKNTNKVVKLANNSTELLHADYDGNAAQLRSVVGRPMGDIYVHAIATDASGQKIVDPNGLYKLDGANWVVAGNAMPKLTGGLLNNLTYKNFDLNIVTDFNFGGSIMPTGINWMISRGLLEESTKFMDAASGGLSYYVNADGKGVQTTSASGPGGETVYHDGMLMDGVTTTGEPNSNVISQAVYYNNTYNWGGPQYSSSRYELYVTKNNYIKMREISLGYSLPSSVARKLGSSNVNLSVFGRNLFFLYRSIKDLDAEQTTSSTRWYENINNAGNNPSFRSMGVMLRASF